MLSYDKLYTLYNGVRHLEGTHLSTINRLCHSSAGYSPASHCGCPCSNPGHLMCDMWWTKWHWGRFPPSTSVYPANSHSTDCSTLIIIYLSSVTGPIGQLVADVPSGLKSHPNPRNQKKILSTINSLEMNQNMRLGEPPTDGNVDYYSLLYSSAVPISSVLRIIILSEVQTSQHNFTASVLIWTASRAGKPASTINKPACSVCSWNLC
jgi:hypothetical protein